MQHILQAQNTIEFKLGNSKLCCVCSFGSCRALKLPDIQLDPAYVPARGLLYICTCMLLYVVHNVEFLMECRLAEV